MNRNTLISRPDRDARVLLAALICGLAIALVSPRAQACSGRPPMPPTLFPGAGAVDVSPMSSLFLGASGVPAALALTADDQPVPLPRIAVLGDGPPGTWFQLSGALAPSKRYVLTMQDNGTTKELTHFATAASYAKPAGTAPILHKLRLWRVHYPVSQVAAGGCVFSEYEGYLDLAYDAGAVPGTPEAEHVQVLRLDPKNGGVGQTYVATGNAPLHFAQVENPGGNGLIDVPDGARPSPSLALWKPELSADRAYCATVTLYGRNDLATLPAVSNSLCASVTSIDLTAAAPSPGGGCTLGRKAPAAGGLWLAGLLLALRRRRAR